MADAAPDKGALAQLVEVLAKPVGIFLTNVLPLLITGGSRAVAFYGTLPQNFIHFFIGFFFCFFGGVYPTLFAAVQAAENGGRKAVMDSLSELSEEAMIIIEQSKKDDDVDADGDGKKDVEQISGGGYLQRKTLLVLKKMNPEKIDKAISSMYTVWLAVAAVLMVHFAQTINIALSLAEFLNKPSDRFLSPLLKVAIPDEYDKWVPVVLRWITKSIAMSIAWYIESVRSAFTSSLIGGLIMARAFLHVCMHRGFTLGGIIPEDHTKSNLDELLSYGFAVLGFYVQFSSGFSVPAPFNLILWPFGLAESYIRWTITSKTGGV